MASLKSIGIKSLRGLSDTGEISLKKINILVGKNSSGKSTFARVFPLFKQSVGSNPRDPLLWWGDLVDFGSYSDAVGSYRDGKRKERILQDYIEFKFKIEGGDENGSRKRKSKVVEYSFRIKAREDDSSYVSYVRIKVGSSLYEAEIAADNRYEKILISGRVVYDQNNNNEHGIYLVNDSVEVFPALSIYSAVRDKNEISRALPPSALAGFFGKRLGQREESDMAMILNYALRFGWDYSAKGLRLALEETSSAHYEKYFSTLDDQALFLLAIPNLIREVSVILKRTFSTSFYVEPLRAAANRYYRKQNLSNAEIDSRGENIAMFLSSHPRISEFKDWVSKHLGFRVEVDDGHGHVSIFIDVGGAGAAKNIADMGFGFSQLLPILAQLWLAGRDVRRLGSVALEERLVIIEQPELHLHPAFQDKIADVFVAAIDDDSIDIDVKIIAETHSPNLINKLGSLVACKKLSKNDVQIIVFDFDAETLKTKISIADFDDDGGLVNWPFGFFEPEVA